MAVLGKKEIVFFFFQIYFMCISVCLGVCVCACTRVHVRVYGWGHVHIICIPGTLGVSTPGTGVVTHNMVLGTKRRALQEQRVL